MKHPSNEFELKALHDILRREPGRYLDIVNAWIKEDPKDTSAYYSRHFAWMHLGQPLLAIKDLDKVIESDGDQMDFMSRGQVYRILGFHKKALEDFARGEALNPEDWDGHQVGLLYQADSYAKLGDETSALTYCSRLGDDFWTPGLDGAPAGNKAEIAEQLKQIAGDARRDLHDL
jgi:tetratricopeptide (TPR) repeat protein